MQTTVKRKINKQEVKVTFHYDPISNSDYFSFKGMKMSKALIIQLVKGK